MHCMQIRIKKQKRRVCEYRGFGPYKVVVAFMLTLVPFSKMLSGSRPLWASVIHGQNLANQNLTATTPVSFAETNTLKKVFGLRKTNKPTLL